MQAFMVVLTIILIYEPKGEASNLLHYYCALVHVSKYTVFFFSNDWIFIKMNLLALSSCGKKCCSMWN